MLKLTEEQKQYIIGQTLKNIGLVEICSALNIERKELYLYTKEHPEFETSLNGARSESVHDLVDSLRTITAKRNTLPAIAKARVESENIKWMASKRNPKQYGDQINLNVSGNIDLSAVLLAADNRVVPILEAKARLLNSSDHSLNSSAVSEAKEVREVKEMNEVDRNKETDKANETSTLTNDIKDLL